jgi:integrase
MPFLAEYTPWNKGRLIGQKRPFRLSEIETIRVGLEERCRLRELAMFNLAIDSKLRASDLVKLKIEEVSVDGKVRDRASVVQKKTAKPVHFEIGSRTRVVLEKWISASSRRSGYLFPAKRHDGRHLSVRLFARIVKSWVRLVGLEPSLYATHTLRRTKVTLLYRKTGNLRAIQLLLGHKSIENTVRYLGIDVDDALELSGQMDL